MNSGRETDLETLKKYHLLLKEKVSAFSNFRGISRPVIKAHGSSKANSIKCCIAQAKEYALSGIIQEYAKMAANPEAYKKQIEGAEPEARPEASENA